MKNDIDSILNSLFSGGKLNAGENTKSRAAREAEEFLASLEKKQRATGAELDKQLSDLDRLNSEAQKSMDEMRRLLENDGIEAAVQSEKKPTAVPGALEEAPRDREQQFKDARETVNSEIIGQDAFLNSLFTAFKRPHITGIDEKKPAAVMIISGHEGTGRHSALHAVSSALAENGVLKNGSIKTIDLSVYASADDKKLLIQDLFSALHSENEIILFENFEKCHRSLLHIISSLAENGTLQLDTRYALQKGMLIDVGTALVPNAVSEISVNGQFLVFITDKKESAFTDAFGVPFMSSVTDVCRTEEFTAESLQLIGRAVMEELAERADKRLDFSISFGADAVQYLAAQFSRKDGVESMDRICAQCFRALSEAKLQHGCGKLSCEARVEKDGFVFVFPDFTVTAFEKSSTAGDEAANEVRAEMDKIVGFDEVKDYVLSLEQNYVIQRLRESRGMKADVPTMHMIFTGNPGTGKTTIARLVARYLKAMGVLSGGQLIEVTRADLVGKYVGHTAPLTQQVLRSAIGGVLFIDEAYSLYRGKDDSFGLEAIDTIVKGMEDNRQDLIVILAGYSKEMSEFLTANSGLRSRFPNIIEFPDYTAQELLKLAQITAGGKGYVIDASCDVQLEAYFMRRQLTDARSAGNGRMARNLVEDAILKQSRRLTAGDVSGLTREQLETLLPEDFELN